MDENKNLAVNLPFLEIQKLARNSLEYFIFNSRVFAKLNIFLNKNIKLKKNKNIFYYLF